MEGIPRDRRRLEPLDPKLDTRLASADELIEQLGLAPIGGEGGWFRRVAEGGPVMEIPARRTRRRAWSSIVALFTPERFSAFHRLAVDELWCFQAGDPIDLFQLRASGGVSRVRLGFDSGVANDTRLQAKVSAGAWQAARVADDGRWSLVACVCVPGFLTQDFELADRAALAAIHPRKAGLIARLTRASALP